MLGRMAPKAYPRVLVAYSAHRTELSQDASPPPLTGTLVESWLPPPPGPSAHAVHWQPTNACFSHPFEKSLAPGDFAVVALFISRKMCHASSSEEEKQDKSRYSKPPPCSTTPRVCRMRDRSAWIWLAKLREEASSPSASLPWGAPLAPALPTPPDLDASSHVLEADASARADSPMP